MTKHIRNIFLTLAALTVFAAPAFAITGYGGGTLFSGNIANVSNNTTGWITISGYWDVPNLTIHIVDAKFDTTCQITERSQIVETDDPGAESGNFALIPTTCYPTRNPSKTFTPGPDAVINLGWSYSSVQSGAYNLVARGMYLMLPQFCIYDGFAGVGQIQP